MNPSDSQPNFTLRPLTATDADELRRIRSLPEVEQWWDAVEDDFPMGDEPEATRLTVTVDGQVAGLIQYSEETEPKYRSASIDIFLDPAVHGRGIGAAALKQVIKILIDKGHHRITVDPAAHNPAAIRAYEKAGFQRVGVMRQAERDADGVGWHDSVMMELLASEWSPSKTA